MEILYLKKDEIEKLFSYSDCVARLNAEEFDEDGDNSQSKQVRQWRTIIDEEGKKQEYLILNLHK